MVGAAKLPSVAVLRREVATDAPLLVPVAGAGRTRISRPATTGELSSEAAVGTAEEEEVPKRGEVAGKEEREGPLVTTLLPEDMPSLPGGVVPVAPLGRCRCCRGLVGTPPPAARV